MANLSNTCVPEQANLTDNRKWVYALPLLALLLFQGLGAAWINGPTLDEPFYVSRGYLALKHQNYGFGMEHPPLAPQIGILPVLFKYSFPLDKVIYLPGTSDAVDWSRTGSAFLYQTGHDPYRMLFTARVPILFLTLALAATVYAWAFELYGLGGALLSLALFVLCPNLIIHGSLFTTDMALTTFMFILMFQLKKFFKSWKIAPALRTGFFAGLTLLSKISGIILFPVVFGLFTLACFIKDEQKQPRDIGRGLVAVAAFVLFLALSNRQSGILFGPLCMVVLGFAFLGKGLPEKKWQKFLLIALYAGGWAGSWLPLLLAVKKSTLSFRLCASLWAGTFLALNLLLLKFKRRESWRYLFQVHSLIWIVASLVIVFDHTDVFLNFFHWRPFGHYIGSFSTSIAHTQGHHVVCTANSFITCDWKYFSASMIAKTPLLSSLLILTGCAGLAFIKAPRMEKLCIIAAPLFFLFVASFMTHINIGVRHVLPLYPFLYLIAGSNAFWIEKLRSGAARTFLYLTLSAACIATLGRNLSFYPDYLAYFTEWVGNSEKGGALTADSNIDWGQNNRRLLEIAKREGAKSVALGTSSFNEMEYQYNGIPLRTMSPEDFVHPAPGFYALNLPTYLAQQNRQDSWFYGKRPNFIAGKTLYLFRVPE